ncbi:hypothetical protein HY492_03425 [Candidatus Woesearchaeota archaeon]|nr:hypothetical protein [Candidatus Woesearchaeota archaeon]
MTDITDATRESYADAATKGVYMGIIVTATGLVGMTAAGKLSYQKHQAERALEHASVQERAGLEATIHDASAANALAAVGFGAILVGATIIGISKHFFTLDKKGYFGN